MAVPAKHQLRQYHVYSPNVGDNVGGHPIIDAGDEVRVVMMHPVQAKYFIDQGVIGDKPYADLAHERKANLAQFHGREPPTKEAPKAKNPSAREHRDNIKG